MKANRYAVINAEGATLRTIVATTKYHASCKVKFKYKNLAPFLKLEKVGEIEIMRTENQGEGSGI